MPLLVSHELALLNNLNPFPLSKYPIFLSFSAGSSFFISFSSSSKMQLAGMQLSLLFCPVIGFVKLEWDSDPEDVLDSQQLDNGVVFETLLLLNKDISERQDGNAKDSKDPKILVDTSSLA